MFGLQAIASGLQGSQWVRKFGSGGAMAVNTDTLPFCQIPKPQALRGWVGAKPHPLCPFHGWVGAGPHPHSLWLDWCQVKNPSPPTGPDWGSLSSPQTWLDEALPQLPQVSDQDQWSDLARHHMGPCPSSLPAKGLSTTSLSGMRNSTLSAVQISH